MVQCNSVQNQLQVPGVPAGWLFLQYVKVPPTTKMGQSQVTSCLVTNSTSSTICVLVYALSDSHFHGINCGFHSISPGVQEYPVMSPLWDAFGLWITLITEVSNNSTDVYIQYWWVYPDERVEIRKSGNIFEVSSDQVNSKINTRPMPYSFGLGTNGGTCKLTTLNNVYIQYARKMLLSPIEQDTNVHTPILVPPAVESEPLANTSSHVSTQTDSKDSSFLPLLVPSRDWNNQAPQLRKESKMFVVA